MRATNNLEAYVAWARLTPDPEYPDKNYATSCRCRAHYKKVYQAQDGRVMRSIVPLPDSQVCARERAWRDYVRVRDGVC